MAKINSGLGIERPLFGAQFIHSGLGQVLSTLNFSQFICEMGMIS